jgi:hypothetical protein
MINYRITNTIILWSKNQEIIKYTNEIAKLLGINAYEPESATDILVTPCFTLILDSTQLKELIDTLGSNEAIDEFFTYMDWKILIYGKIKFKMPWIVQNSLEEIPYVISKKYLLKSIKENHELALREDEYRKKQFKQRIFRIISLYHLNEIGCDIDIEVISFRFEISYRTLARDLEVLKNIMPKLNIVTYKTGDSKSMRSSRATKINRGEITLRQLALFNQVKRIINLYQTIKKGYSIHVEKTCEKFSITYRTLSRDIKLLREINPERKISFDKLKGYY